MSSAGPVSPRQAKNERREVAREKAKLLREQQLKRDKRIRLVLVAGIGGVALAVIVVVAVVLVNSIRPAGPGPANMASDGLKVGANFVAVSTPPLQSGQTPIPSARNEAGVVDIQIYLDYLCPVCSTFEAANSSQISALVKSGAATVEIHPIAILTSLSLGTQYSVRSANAAACVANYSADKFYDFNSALFANQPKERTEGLTDAALVDLATKVGAPTAAVEKCVKDKEFKPWVLAATDRALKGPIPNSDVTAVSGTPTVIVNGVKYNGSFSDPKEFASFLLAQSSNKNSTPTPTPSVPVPTPSR